MNICEETTPVARQVAEAVEMVNDVQEAFYTEEFQPCVNDEVRILKRWELRRGIIQGFTVNGKHKIYKRNRQTILWLPKNVVCER